MSVFPAGTIAAVRRDPTARLDPVDRLVALAGALVLRPLLVLRALSLAVRPATLQSLPAPSEPLAPPARRFLVRSVVRRGPPLLAI